jgi:hypothetical protein
MDENHKDGRGHAPGSMETRIKKGEKKNPHGRPKGAKGISATMKKALLNTVTLQENGKIKRVTMIEAMVEGSTKHIIKGDPRYLDLALDIFFHISKLEQVREYTAEEREHRKVSKDLVRVYEAHHLRLLELTEDEFDGVVKAVKEKQRQARGGPLKPIEEIAADIIAEDKLKKG